MAGSPFVLKHERILCSRRRMHDQNTVMVSGHNISTIADRADQTDHAAN